MPIYEYRCTSCQHTFEVLANFSDEPPTTCEACGKATIEKVLHPVQINYKGSGFYSTDYGASRSGSRSSDGDSGGSGSGSSDSSKSSGSGSKSDSGSSSKSSSKD